MLKEKWIIWSLFVHSIHLRCMKSLSLERLNDSSLKLIYAWHISFFFFEKKLPHQFILIEFLRIINSVPFWNYKRFGEKTATYTSRTPLDNSIQFFFIFSQQYTLIPTLVPFFLLSSVIDKHTDAYALTYTVYIIHYTCFSPILIENS